MPDVSSSNQSTIQEINDTGIIVEHYEAEISHDKEIGDTNKSRLTETDIFVGRTEMNLEYEQQLTLQETFDVRMDPELQASNGEVEDMDISGLTDILTEMNDMSFAPLLNHALQDDLDSLSFAVSAALSSDIQEDQALSMNNTSNLSSIQVLSADATKAALPLAEGLLDTEADQPRSLISQNELSPPTLSTSSRIQLAAKPVIEIDKQVSLIKERPILSGCDLGKCKLQCSLITQELRERLNQSNVYFLKSRGDFSCFFLFFSRTI